MRFATRPFSRSPLGRSTSVDSFVEGRLEPPLLFLTDKLVGWGLHVANHRGESQFSEITLDRVTQQRSLLSSGPSDIDPVRLLRIGPARSRSRGRAAHRPTKLTPEIAQKICDVIRASNYFEVAAAYCLHAPAWTR